MLNDPIGAAKGEITFTLDDYAAEGRTLTVEFDFEITDYVPTIDTIDASISNVVYESAGAAQTFNFNAYSFTPSTCPYTFTYSASQDDGSALPSPITFNAVDRTFSVQSNDIDAEGTWTIVVTASLDDIYQTSDNTLTFQLDVSNNFDQDQISVQADTEL